MSNIALSGGSLCPEPLSQQAFADGPTDCRSAFDANDLFGTQGSSTDSAELAMPGRFGTARHTGDRLPGNGVAAVGTERLLRRGGRRRRTSRSTDSRSALGTDDLRRSDSRSALTAELSMTSGLGAARHTSDRLFGNGIAAIRAKQLSRSGYWYCLWCWSGGKRRGGEQSGNLSSHSLVSALGFQRRVRSDDSLCRQCSELLVVNRTLFLAVGVGVKIVRHGFRALVKGYGKNGKRRYRLKRRERHVAQDGLLLRTTRVPRKTSGDVSAKRAHTPKSASPMHDIPFRERMFHQVFTSSNRRTGL